MKSKILTGDIKPDETKYKEIFEQVNELNKTYMKSIHKLAKEHVDNPLEFSTVLQDAIANIFLNIAGPDMALEMSISVSNKIIQYKSINVNSNAEAKELVKKPNYFG